jgi:hypothetical protein
VATNPGYNPPTRKRNHPLDEPLGLSELLARASGNDAAAADDDDDDAGDAHEQQDTDSSDSSGDEGVDFEAGQVQPIAEAGAAALRRLSKLGAPSSSSSSSTVSSQAFFGDRVGAEGDEDNDDDVEQPSRPKAIQPPHPRLGLPSSSPSPSSSSSASSFSSSSRCSQPSFPSAILKLPTPASTRMFLGHKAAKRLPNRKQSAPKKRVKQKTSRERDAHFVTELAKDLEQSMKDDTQFERTSSGRARRTPRAKDGTLLGWQ